MIGYGLAGRSARTAKLIVLGLITLTLAACVPVLGDPRPRPVGIGRASDGRLRFLLVLCSDERVASVEVANNVSFHPIWRVSQPKDELAQGGQVILGDSTGFSVVELPLTSPIPFNIDVTVGLESGRRFGSAFIPDEIPPGIAGTNSVVNAMEKVVSEDEFREDVEGEYC